MMKNYNLPTKFEKDYPEYWVWTIHGSWTVVLRAMNSRLIYSSCWNCWSTVKRSIDTLWYPKCRVCANKYKKEEYLYWISAITISKRIRRWWSMLEALEIVPRKIQEENFSDNDIKYLSKILEKDYAAANEIARRVEQKHLFSIKY